MCRIAPKMAVFNRTHSMNCSSFRFTSGKPSDNTTCCNSNAFNSSSTKNVRSDLQRSVSVLACGRFGSSPSLELQLYHLGEGNFEFRFLLDNFGRVLHLTRSSNILHHPQFVALAIVQVFGHTRGARSVAWASQQVS
jgi:hypothetical protein